VSAKVLQSVKCLLKTRLLQAVDFVFSKEPQRKVEEKIVEIREVAGLGFIFAEEVTEADDEFFRARVAVDGFLVFEEQVSLELPEMQLEEFEARLVLFDHG
jgi:hypothetical protein